jgi:hypothetical protein
MAQITGYVCDICHQFSLNRDSWLKVSSYADKDAAHIDVCGNKCLSKLAKERAEAAGETLSKQRERRIHSVDHKVEVVESALEHGVGVTAKKFDLSASLIRRWIHLYESGELK